MAQALEEVRKQREELQQQVGPVGCDPHQSQPGLIYLPISSEQGVDTGLGMLSAAWFP